MSKKRQRRDFTDEFKNDAVKPVIEQGYSCSEVARRLGVGHSKNANMWGPNSPIFLLLLDQT